MAGFNPDKFLAETAPKAGAFDPDKFLAETTQPEQGLGEKITRGALRTLPLVGGVVGGIVGTPADVVAGPMGTVAGAGLGAAAGEALKNIGEKYLLGDQKTRSQVWTDPVTAGGQAMMAETGGQLIGKIPDALKAGANSAKALIASKLGQDIEYSPVANKEAIEAAAKKLGIEKVPKALLTDNPTYQKLESGLSQSGSLPAKTVRDQYNDFFKGMKDATSKIADLKTPESNVAIGKDIQKGLTDEVSKMKSPVSELYEEMRPHFQNIEVNKGAVNRSFNELKNDPMFQTVDGKAMLQEYKKVALNTPELNSLKELRSNIGESLGGTASPLDVKRAEAIRNVMTKIRDESILAKRASLPKSDAGQVDDLLNQIALADTVHSSNIDDLNSVKELVTSRPVKSPSQFINKVKDMNSEEMTKSAANLDFESMSQLKEKMPTVFERARQAKINDMIQRSSPSGSFNENTFLRQYDKLDQEMKDLVFTPDMQKHIEAVKTIKLAMPEKLGPSGTPEGKMLMQMFDPYRNAMDLGIKKALGHVENRGAEAIAEAIPKNVVPLKAVSPKLQSIPRSFETSSPSMPMQNAAKNDEPKKGPAKWANDGFEKLIQHSDEELKNQLKDKRSELLDDPKINELLQQASDLKPGTKAMDDIAKKIKNRVSKVQN